jgi:cytochrome c
VPKVPKVPEVFNPALRLRGLPRIGAAGLLWLLVGQPVQANELYEARCGGCHSVAQDRVGPRHAGLANRLAGSVKGFGYSQALLKAGAVDGLRWNASTLERWLTDPERLVPGQAMGYSLANPQERQAIIDYLIRLP